MVRTYLLTLKIINSVFFIWLLLIFLLTIFDFDAVITTADNELVILAFFGAVRNVFSYIIYGGGLLIASVFAMATAGAYSQYMFNFIEIFFERYLSGWFNIGTPSLGEIPNLILSEVEVLFNDLYLFAFQILIVVSIIYAIRAFFKSDPKNHLVALGSIILMIVLPLMVFGLREMLDLFGLHFDYLDQMADPLDPSLF